MARRMVVQLPLPCQLLVAQPGNGLLPDNEDSSMPMELVAPPTPAKK